MPISTFLPCQHLPKFRPCGEFNMKTIFFFLSVIYLFFFFFDLITRVFIKNAVSFAVRRPFQIQALWGHIYVNMKQVYPRLNYNFSLVYLPVNSREFTKGNASINWRIILTAGSSSSCTQKRISN